ncbi:diaminopimelate epimerase [Candidatus Pelagibacter sp.]|jgi:diaminopimelate epimerase|nr:diaminopimelate epimerase [Candidatus Pelagibacter sp.]MDC3385347.1 diaminopimelate epimerase [Candidatus Pelagibacter sp.]
MEFSAYKMDGLGNDFVIIDNRSKPIILNNEQILKICDRKFIGCDQLIFINAHEKSDAKIDFFNSDGSTSGACGNGTRCVADLLSKENGKKNISLVTSEGELKSDIIGDNLVETGIGFGKTNWNEIPLAKNVNTKNLQIEILDNDNKSHIGGTAISVGNPHVIFFVSDLEKFNIEKIGPTIENHELFPERCNVTIGQVINEKLIKVKVWERGAGLTKACGTAACATAFAGLIHNISSNQVDIEFKTGNLTISIDQDNFIKMKGPVSDIKKIDIKL